MVHAENAHMIYSMSMCKPCINKHEACLFLLRCIEVVQSTHGHLNHIKDMHEIKTSNHTHLIGSDARGVTARAGSVQLMYFNDWKLARKGKDLRTFCEEVV